MLTSDNIKQIINECREIGNDGFVHGIQASIPDLIVDIVTPPLDFLGVSGNPAIFINKATFKLLGSLHSNWIVDQTIALKVSLLTKSPIEVIGAIVHETGHAFNVAAKIENTETNAYIFEIEAMLQLLKTNNLLLFSCSASDVQEYFKLRLTYYIKGAYGNEYLTGLVEKIKNPPELKPKPKEIIVPKIDPALSTGLINKKDNLPALSDIDESTTISKVPIGQFIKAKL